MAQPRTTAATTTTALRPQQAIGTPEPTLARPASLVAEPTAPYTAAAASFNLVDDPWIPCMPSRMSSRSMRNAQSRPLLLSLRQVFLQAPRLWQLADPSPVVTISLHRLLLAILHRSVQGPRDVQAWSALSRRSGAAGALQSDPRGDLRGGSGALRGGSGDARGAWNPDVLARIDAYLTRWRSRFDLFDLDVPFFQTAWLPENGRATPASALLHERASSRNQPLLFDHTTSGPRAWLAPDVAARGLLVQQNFAVGGLISYDSAREPLANKFASMAPLLGAAVCLLRGETLFETLLLNCVRYQPEDPLPHPNDHGHDHGRAADHVDHDDGRTADDHHDDLPAWEREQLTAPVERTPDGYVDLLTWQSRRIRLIPLVTPEGATMVERVIMMKGYQFPPDFAETTRRCVETMIPFRVRATPPATARAASARAASATATGSPSSWTALTMPSSDRALWRECQSLFARSDSGARDHFGSHTVDGESAEVKREAGDASASRHARPKTFDWVAHLLDAGLLDGRRVVSLECYGMLPDRANIEDWRHASMPLPLALLHTDALAARLCAAVALAEQVACLLGPEQVTLTTLTHGDATALPPLHPLHPPHPLQPTTRQLTVSSPVRLLADALLVGASAVPATVTTAEAGGNPPRKAADRSAVDRSMSERIVARWDAQAHYWAHLDAPFRQLVLTLAATSATQAAATQAAGEQAAAEQAAEEQAAGDERLSASDPMRVWALAVERVVRQGFQRVLGMTDLAPSAACAARHAAYVSRARAYTQARFDTYLATLLASQDIPGHPRTSHDVHDVPAARG